MPAACLRLSFWKTFFTFPHSPIPYETFPLPWTHQSHVLFSEQGNVPAVHLPMQGLFLLCFCFLYNSEQIQRHDHVVSSLYGCLIWPGWSLDSTENVSPPAPQSAFARFRLLRFVFRFEKCAEQMRVQIWNRSSGQQDLKRSLRFSLNDPEWESALYRKMRAWGHYGL